MKTIQKKWINLSILYAILGLASGVFTVNSQNGMVLQEFPPYG